jgi:hypothetical protein
MAKSLGEYEAETLAAWTQRRVRIELRVQSFIDQKLKQVNLTIAQRVKFATNFLRDKVKANLSRPVRKIKSRTRTVVDPASRSKKGEFPRADTSRLMKDIFVAFSDDGMEGRVGTTLKYGLILETKMDRSFLRRTMNEMRHQVIAILMHGQTPGAGQVETTGLD